MHHSSGTWGVPNSDAISGELVCAVLASSHLADISIVRIDLSFNLLTSRWSLCLNLTGGAESSYLEQILIQFTRLAKASQTKTCPLREELL